MAFSDAEKLVSLGLSHPLSVELVTQISARASSADRLVAVGVPVGLAIEIATQINSGSYSAERLVSLGMPSEVAYEVRNLIQGGGGVPSNNRFALAGDSRAAADHLNSDASTIYHRVEGIGFWTQIESNQAVIFRREDDYAVAGSTSEHFLNNQVPDLVASDAANVLLLTSTNDQGANNWAASRSIAAISAGIDALLAAGKWLWVIAELPRGSASFPGARFTAQQQIDHDLVRDYLLGLSHRRITVIDPYPVVSDVGGTETDFIDAATYDGTHLSSNGARLVASVVVPTLAAWFSADDFAYSASDTYNSSSNPDGNLVDNSEMAGTSGSGVNGSTILGQVADGWTAAVGAFTGLTATCSKVTDGSGNTWQQIRVQGNSPSGTPLVQVRRNITFANVSLADVLELRYGEWEVDAGAVGFMAPEANITRLLSGANVQSTRSASRSSGPWPTGEVIGTWRSSSELTIAGDENTVQFAAQFYVEPSKTGVDFTVRFRAPVLRKVIA